MRTRTLRDRRSLRAARRRTARAHRRGSARSARGCRAAVARAVVDDEVAVRGRHDGAAARARPSARRDRRARRPTAECRRAPVAPGDRGSGRCSRRSATPSGCVRLRYASDARAMARSASGSPRADDELRRQRAPHRCPAAGCGRSRTPSRCRGSVGDRRRRRASAHARDELAMIRRRSKCALPWMRAADRARRAGPRLEAGQAVPDRPAHEAVDRDAGVGAHAVRRPSASIVAAARPHDQAADAGVGDEHVRAAAEHRHAHARRRARRRTSTISRRARLDEPVRRTADLEGRQRRERRVAPHAIGAEPPSMSALRSPTTPGVTRAASRRSC